MDDTQGSRLSDAVAAATRKRRSSILKSQRPPRTPFSELEFNVATPTDTAKSRRVSFSRRTGVAEFITNEATTSLKTFFKDQNKSLESSGNDLNENPQRPTIGHLGKRIFDQQFEEFEAVDYGGSIMPSSNPRVQEMNMSMNANFTQQIAALEGDGDDRKLAVPQQNFELSSLTDHRSKIFGDDLTIPTMGEMSNKIDINFSAIQPVGSNNDKCDDLDEIQRDLEWSQPNVVCQGPFNDRRNISEYIEVDLNMTHVGMKNDDSNMSITDTIHSPKEQNLLKNIISVASDNKSDTDKDWIVDKENIAINPYVAPRESANFAINEVPDEVLVFDGRKLSIQKDQIQRDKIEQNFRKTLLPNENCDPPPQRKTIVLNVHDDLPNFLDDASLLGQVHGLSISRDVVEHKNNINSACDNSRVSAAGNKMEVVHNSRNTVIYNSDDIANISVTQAVPTNILQDKDGKAKRKTIVFENETGNLSLTQAVPANFLEPSKEIAQNRTVNYGNENNISFTQAVPVNLLISEGTNTKWKDSKSSDTQSDFDISFTRAVPNNMLLSNKSTLQNTAVYSTETGDISITRVLPSNILTSENHGYITEAEKSKILQNNESVGYISMTEAIPKNIILLNNKTTPEGSNIFNRDNDQCNISETQILATNIIESKTPTKVYMKEDEILVHGKFNTQMSMTETIPENILANRSLLNQVKTLNSLDNIGDISVTQTLPSNIIVTDTENILAGVKSKSICEDNDYNNCTISQIITENTPLSNSGQNGEGMNKTYSHFIDIKETDAVEVNNFASDSNETPSSKFINMSITQVLHSSNVSEISKSHNAVDLVNIESIASSAPLKVVLKNDNEDKKNRKTIECETETENSFSKNAVELVNNASIPSYAPTNVLRKNDNKYMEKRKTLEYENATENLSTYNTGNLINNTSVAASATSNELLKNYNEGNEKRKTIEYENATENLSTYNTGNLINNTSVAASATFNELLKNYNEGNEKRKTIEFENATENLSMAQGLTTKLIEKSKEHALNRTVVNDIENVSYTKDMTINVPVSETIDTLSKTITKSCHNEIDVSFTQVLPNNMLLSNKSSTLPNKRNTLVYRTETGDISINRVHSEYHQEDNYFSMRKDEENLGDIDRFSVNKQDSYENICMTEDIKYMSNSESINTMPNDEDPLNTSKSLSVCGTNTMESKKFTEENMLENEGEKTLLNESRTTIENYKTNNLVTEVSTENILSPKIPSLNKSKCVNDISETENIQLKTFLPEKEERSLKVFNVQNSAEKTITAVNNDCHNFSINHAVAENILPNNFQNSNIRNTTLHLPTDLTKTKPVELSDLNISTHEVAPKESSIKIDLSKSHLNRSVPKEVHSNDMSQNVKGDNDVENKSDSNKLKRISLAKHRSSVVLSREDLLNNISMAQAALKQACSGMWDVDIDESETVDDTLEDQSEVMEEVITRRMSVRVSTEVVKTLHFDDSVNEMNLKSDANLSPLRKTAFDNITCVKDTKAKVIPPYLSEVSDDIKSLMNDLVKPLVDEFPSVISGGDKIKKQDPSTSSIQIQANIITSSQIDIDVDSYPESQCDIVTSESNNEIKNCVVIAKSPLKETCTNVDNRNHHSQPEPVLIFDHINPLNNIMLSPKGETDIHKYSPMKYTETSHDVKLSELAQDSCTEIVDDEELKVGRVSTHFNINTCAAAICSDLQSGDLSPRKQENQNIMSVNVTLSANTSVDNLKTHITDTEVNTLIAMKSNKELLDASSSLTLVDDDEVNVIEINEDICEVKPESKKHEKTSPLKVIFKMDVESNKNITSNVDLGDVENGNKAKKRIYSPAKHIYHRKVSQSSPVVSPKPLSKIQKLSTSPQMFKNKANRASTAELDKCENALKDSVTSPKVSSDSKLKPETDVIVQHLTTEYKIDRGIMENSRKPLDGTDSCSSSSTLKLEMLSKTGIKNCSSQEMTDSFTSTSSASTTASQGTGKVQCATSHKDRCPMFKEQEYKNRLAECTSSVNVLSKIDALPFMGSRDCKWECCEADTLRFRLLHGRLRLAARLGHVSGDEIRCHVSGDEMHYHVSGDEPRCHVSCDKPRGHVSADTPVLGVTVDVAHDDAEAALRACARLAGEAVRYECARGRGAARAGELPALLRRCAAVARLAARWARAMRDARAHLACALADDGRLTLKVANVPLRCVWEVAMRIELVVDDAREAAWPRAGCVRVRDCTHTRSRDVTRDAKLSRDGDVTRDANHPRDGDVTHDAKRPRDGDVTHDAKRPRNGDVTDEQAHDLQRTLARMLARVPHDWGHVPRTIWRVFRYLKNKTKDDELFGIHYGR